MRKPPSTLPTRNLRGLYLVSILLIGGGVAFHFKTASTSAQNRSEPVREISADPKHTASANYTDPIAVDNAALADTPPTSAPAPTAIFAILPSIQTRIENWRQYRPATYTVKTTPDSPAVTFYLSEIKDEDRFTTWIGRSTIPGESFVAVATTHGLDAVMTTLSSQPVEIQIRGDRIAINNTASDIEEAGCGAEPTNNTVSPGTSAVRCNADQVMSQVLVQDRNGNSIAGVVYLYDNLALAQANLDALDGNGAAFIDANFKARIESCNTFLVNSQINVRWAYLGSYQCPDHGDTPIQSLWSIVRNPATAVGAYAAQKASETGATHVQLYTKPTDAQWGGYADVYGHFGVIRYGSSNTTISHELGHNYGLNHDRVTMIPSALSPVYDGNYSYGMVFAISSDATGNPVEQLGDIMSYAGRRIPYFTNSNIQISQYAFSATRSYTALSNGNIYLGTLQTTADPLYIYNLPNATNVQPLGVPAGLPYACDGSRSFRENASTIISSGWYAAPSITSQPANISIAPGQSFTLSVGSAGPGATFTYQWYKGATNITGATSSSFSVASAQEADSGSYSVTITANQAAFGNVTTLTSSPASVTVSQAQTPQNPPGNTSNGSGGAVSPISTVLLIALLCLKNRRTCRMNTTS